VRACRAKGADGGTCHAVCGCLYLACIRSEQEERENTRRRTNIRASLGVLELDEQAPDALGELAILPLLILRDKKAPASARTAEEPDAARRTS
jgi:hypothetical protein